jgi:hypothetical protein
MKIWVDADARPKVIKEILFRVADRGSVKAIPVANQLLPAPDSSFVRCMTVPSDIDAADHAIDPLPHDIAWIENPRRAGGFTSPATQQMSWRLCGCDLVLVEETQDFGFLIAPGPT